MLLPAASSLGKVVGGLLMGGLLSGGLTQLPVAQAVVAWISLSVALYAAAAHASKTEPLWRSVLLGLNMGLNAVCLSRWLGGSAVALFVVLAGSTAIFSLVRTARTRQALGWAGWILPLSWPASFVGLVAFLLHGLWPPAVRQVQLDRRTGSIVLIGGWLWWPGFYGGYSLGQFAFVTPDALGVIGHETGHTLNNAAFGSLFHFIGAVDELLIQRHWADAYAERLAESHQPQTQQANIVPLWRESGPQGRVEA